MFLAGARGVSLFRSVQTVQLSFEFLSGIFFVEVKWPEHGVDLSPSPGGDWIGSSLERDELCLKFTLLIANI